MSETFHHLIIRKKSSKKFKLLRHFCPFFESRLSASVLLMKQELEKIGNLDGKWWQQDGATCHTTKKFIEFLESGYKIISRRSNHVNWPSCSPDLNPLDFSFWGLCETEINEKKPRNKAELKAVINEFCANLDQDFVKSIVRNMIKRARLCVSVEGGHFEHLMKLSSSEE